MKRIEDTDLASMSQTSKEQGDAAIHRLHTGQTMAKEFAAHEIKRKEIALPHRLEAICKPHGIYGRGFAAPVVEDSFGQLSDSASGSEAAANSSPAPSQSTGPKRSRRRSSLHSRRSSLQGANHTAVNAFQRAVNEETAVITITDFSVEIPKCQCGDECILRRYEEQDYSIDLWVCGNAQCMFYRSHAIDGTVPEAIVEANANLDQADATASAIAEPSAQLPDETDSQYMQRIDMEQYWRGIDADCVYPDEAMADILAGTQEVPSCFCGVPCRIAICLHTGDLFWLCSARGCKYVQFSMERPAANDLDLGQFVGLGSAEIDRYTTWTYIMRWFGHSFSSKFFAGLMQQEHYPPGSFRMEEGEEYDYFLSYRGGSGRFWLYVGLCGALNFQPALCVMVFLFPFIGGMLFFIKTPCDQNVPHFFIQPGTCDYNAVLQMWLIFTSWGALILALTFFLWNPVLSFANKWLPWAAKRIFFDKYCISQWNPAYAVVRLPLFLRSSKTLMCLLDLEFMTRLWCVFELAVFLRLRKNPDVNFVFLPQRALEIIAVSYAVIWYSINWIITTLWLSGSTCTTDGCQQTIKTLTFVFDVIIFSVIFFLGQSIMTYKRELLKQVANYDCRNAHLQVEADRALLLKFIDELFSDRETEQKMADLAAGSPSAVVNTLATDGDQQEAELITCPIRRYGHVIKEQNQEPDVESQPVNGDDFDVQIDSPRKGVVCPTPSHKLTSSNEPARRAATSVSSPRTIRLEVDTCEHDDGTQNAPTYFDIKGHSTDRDAHNAADTTPVHEISFGQIKTDSSNSCGTPLQASDIQLQDDRPGIRVFNQAVALWVPQHFEAGGLRSWAVMSYQPSVLIGSIFLLGTLDALSYNAGSVDATPIIYFSSFGQGLRTILSIAYQVFVMTPVAIYFIGVEIRLFLLLQDLTKAWLPNVHTTIITIFWFCIYIFFEEIMALRTQFFVLLSAWLELSIANCYFPTRHSSSTGFVFSRVLGFATLTSRPYELHFDFWYGVRKTWDVIDLDNFAEEAQIALATGESFTIERSGYSYSFEVKDWMIVLTWIFLVFPIAFFCYYIYETRASREYRKMLWRKYISRKTESAPLADKPLPQARTWRKYIFRATDTHMRTTPPGVTPHAVHEVDSLTPKVHEL